MPAAEASAGVAEAPAAETPAEEAAAERISGEEAAPRAKRARIKPAAGPEVAESEEDASRDVQVDFADEEAALAAQNAGLEIEGATPEEDKALEEELLADEKELSEHNMLVDLGRNDIGKISRFGTVALEKYLSIERFSHVMHIGSTVRGELREDCDAVDAIDAILPAGTLSGAPKLRAAEIIDALEDSKRGVYGGAIGYLDFTGNLDTCIAIRIAYQKNGRVFVRSGAGIVADSVPETEYEECLNKAKAVMRALELAQEVEP